MRGVSCSMTSRGRHQYPLWWEERRQFASTNREGARQVFFFSQSCTFLRWRGDAASEQGARSSEYQVT